MGFRPRVLIDVSSIDNSTEFIGQTLRIPVLLAPIGSLQVFDSKGGITVAKAAEKFGTIQVVSSVTEPSLEETMESSKFSKIFQLYVQGDWEWTKNMISRVEEAGYKALCITVDTAVYSRRERPMLSNWIPISQRNKVDPKWRASLTWDDIDKIKNLNINFQSNINGIDIHFIYEKGSGAKPQPLLLVHGWPGSIIEFLHVVDKLLYCRQLCC